MRILLTGGTGFIGSRAALLARNCGFDVTVTGQTNTEAEAKRKSELEQAGIRITAGDLRDPAFARSIVLDRTAVIHLAAAQHEANVPARYFHEVNVDGTRTLLEASRAANVRRFVYGSSIGVYGDAAGEVLDEDSPTRPVNPYGQSKLDAEGVVREYAAAIETSIVRISETYGPGDMRLLKLFSGIQRGVFPMIGPGTNKHQLIHVNDLARGLLTVAQHPNAIGGTFILAGREVLTTQELVEHIAAAVHHPPPTLHLPLWPLQAAAIALELTCRPLGIQPPLHRRRLDFFVKSFLFSTKKAETMLGIVPQTLFKDGASETAAWYGGHGCLRTNLQTKYA